MAYPVLVNPSLKYCYLDHPVISDDGSAEMDGVERNPASDNIMEIKSMKRVCRLGYESQRKK